MAHDHGRACACVWEHRPPVLELHRHHILPLYLGGPNTADNIVWLCPTTHTNVHELLRMMMTRGPLTYRDCQELQDRPVSRYAHAVALDGYQRWQAAAA